MNIYTVLHISPLLLSAGVGTTFNPKVLKGRDQKKNERLVGVKEFLSWIFAPEGRGAYFVSCQKRLLKIRYSFEGSISNGDLGLF